VRKGPAHKAPASIIGTIILTISYGWLKKSFPPQANGFSISQTAQAEGSEPDAH
jgi:hypothetical protein